MDDTQQSRVSDAAATRKRRSSILKSQRPPRAPFSELEFNVATPTDTSKSRRVSFSRRTGVAEFVTNEATTTWKTFYEEHNRTLESSGNDSEVKPPRPSVGHLGKRIFDQQFQEVEAVDFVSADEEGRNRNAEVSMNNFTDHIENLECTSDDRKLVTPQQKFELSTFTDNQSKLFGDDLAISGMGELTDRISVNFSVMQPLNGEKDDLDEIQRDLEQVQSNMQVVVGPRDGRNLSEYIEVDLNTTHVAIRNDESDMSITDTIQSPKVQEVPKPNVSVDKNINLDKDWVADKENIIVNPYVAPKESATFAINEEPDKVLVFDGKRLTIQTEPAPSKVDYRQTLLPDIPPDQTPLRKTIVLNVNDDLPNFVDDPFASMSQITKGISIGNQTIRADLSMTHPVPNNLENIEKRRTIVYESDTGNISVTQAIPTNIILTDKTSSDKRKTIVYDNDSGDISVTQAIMSNIILADKAEPARRRKTIVFEDDAGNLSITHAISSNILLQNKDNAVSEKRRTIVFETDSGNISMTQAIPTNIIMQDKNTTINDDNTNEISLTKVVNKESDNNKRNTIVFDSDVGDISMTQAIPSNILGQNISEAVERRKTVVYEDNAGNISITQAVPKSLFLPEMDGKTEKRKTVVFETDTGNISVPSNILAQNISDAVERRKTVVYEDDAGNISITQAVPKSLFLPEMDTKTEKRKTIVFQTDTGNISVTEAVSSNLILPEKEMSKNMSIFQTDFELSVTDLAPANLEQYSEEADRRKTVVYEEDTGNISITQAVPSNILGGDSKRKTIVHEDSGNISVTQAVSSNVILEEEIKMFTKIRASLANLYDSADLSITEGEPPNMMHENASPIKEKSSDLSSDHISSAKTSSGEILKKINVSEENIDDKENEISDTQEIPQFVVNKEMVKRKTLVFDDDSMNMSMTKPIPVDLIAINNDISNEMPKKGNEDGTQPNIEDYPNVKHDVFVYQTSTEDTSIRTEQGDSATPNFAESSNYKIEEKVSFDNIDKDPNQSSTKILDVNAEKSLISGTCEEDIPLPTTDNISTDANLEKEDSSGSKTERKSKKSVLSDLLDMSNASMDLGGCEDKNIMAVVESETQSKVALPKDGVSSSSDGSLFLIVRDSEDETQTDKTSKESKTHLVLPQLKKQPLLPIEFKADISLTEQFDNEFSMTKNHEERQSFSRNRYFEAVVGSDLGNEIEASSPVSVKSYGDANNTNEILKMLSNFTDKEEEDNPLEPVKTDEDGENHLSVQERLRFDLGRFNLSLKKDSASISRENSIVATHEKSYEDVDNAIISPENRSMGSKKVRLSPDVRKTLQFEDESTSEASFRLDTIQNPLKKTVFGETSYMKDNKAKKKEPIPSYLKDVSDGIKQLMSDLVKPMADVMPFESSKVDKAVKKMTSTCSMQIQANLIASSQIDLDSDLHNNDSVEECSDIVDRGRASQKARKSSMKHARISQPEFEYVTEREPELLATRTPVDASVPGRVLVFDHSNPLNNVLLTPADLNEAHPYDPIKSYETLYPDKRQNDGINNQYLIESLLTMHPQAGEALLGKISEVQSDASNMSKPLSTDQSIDAPAPDLTNTEVNTLIAMKPNQELLEASSSLTLVDDTMANEKLDVDSTEVVREQSPVEIIYKVDNDDDYKTSKMDSDVTSNEEHVVNTRKKRAHSPSKSNKVGHGNQSNIELTPKPLSKIPRLPNSPEVIKAIVRRESPQRSQTDPESSKETPMNDEKFNEMGKKVRKKSPRKSQGTKTGTTITVQQLITEYHIEAKIDQETLNDQIMEALKSKVSLEGGQKSPVAVSSCTSSKNRNDMGDASDTTSDSQSCGRSKASPMHWQPELINELSSKNLAVECESGVNVVAKIDMLPFMGSRECEWESSSGDWWSFRLLHGRLRMSVHLAHRHDNASRSVVRADTPVLHTALDATQQDKMNPVAVLCVNFAAEAMRWNIARGCTRAGDVPSLLRRAAGVARVALHWGRAMRDAWAHLAYTLTDDGFLTLKVANIPLRSVWEVTMQLELAADDARELPYPRARDVRVVAIVSDVRVREAEVARAIDHVRQDWGHAPRTIWKIFRYLKNKTRDDALLL